MKESCLRNPTGGSAGRLFSSRTLEADLLVGVSLIKYTSGDLPRPPDDVLAGLVAEDSEKSTRKSGLAFLFTGIG